MAYPVAMDTHPSLPPELWERTPAAIRAHIEMLEGQVQTLTSMVHTLQEQVHTLEERLNQTSRNSSRPPSSDPPQHQRPRRPPGKRRRGGQPGHPGHTRTLVPVEEVDEVVVLKPKQCSSCQAPLSGDDASPFRHQVIEIPPIKPVITEYQWHQLTCPACGETTRAPWPDGVPSGTYGPRVHATVALCTGSYRLSKRTTRQVMDDLFGVPMSASTISQSEQVTTEVVAKPVEEARAYVQEQAVAHLDETSWRQGDKRAWLWVAVTSLVTVFLVRMSRGGQVARELLGEKFSGILVTDRYSAYNWYPVRWRQVCWAHLLRDFEAIRGRGGRSEEIGDALLAQAHQMFAWWHRVREGTLQRSTFRSYMSPLRREVERLLEVGRQCGVPKTEGTCREILKRREALWTFVQVEGVEPTNNTAERSIRPGVQWRKGSFGTQSEDGSRFVESMMTVVATLKQQQRNVLEYLTAAHEAALRGEAAPSLIPAREMESQAAA
ncbi:MAG TPA: IS66 family transposase [Candidatus Tectomicrobia bacterium]|nr:IS66 family transposase [Candidatus Tectomicrobia bacterium]